MKKIFLPVLCMCLAFISTAQDFKKLNTTFLIGRKEDAKGQIDKMMSDPKVQSKPEAWYWQSTIYGALYDDTSLRKKYPDALEIATAAYFKYLELDPSLKVTESEPGPGKLFINFVYGGNFNKGIASFDKKQWDSAYKYFATSAQVGSLIVKNNWGVNKQAIDTVSVLFTGYAAQNAKKTEDAAKYFSQLADQRVTRFGTVGELKDIYQYLVSYYSSTKNAAAFNKYITISKQLFPQDQDTWNDWEIDFIENNYSLAEKTAAYDKGDAAQNLTANQYASFGSMFYNIRQEEKEKLDSVSLKLYRNKSEEAFAKAFNKDNKLATAAYNIGLINYNDWIDLTDVYETNFKRISDLNKSKLAEKDPKKKAANDAKINKQVDAIKAANNLIEKNQHVFADKAIEWMEKAYKVYSEKASLDRNEKNYANKAADRLANLYSWKRDKAKGNDKEYDKYDALFKKYDALHGKY
jgi:hypothetical protein